MLRLRLTRWWHVQLPIARRPLWAPWGPYFVTASGVLSCFDQPWRYSFCKHLNDFPVMEKNFSECVKNFPPSRLENGWRGWFDEYFIFCRIRPSVLNIRVFYCFSECTYTEQFSRTAGSQKKHLYFPLGLIIPAARFEPGNGWVRSENATAVVCRPPT